MDYPIKMLSQLKPILQGFRKTAGLTQAAMASHLGVTQQTYAQLEANPTAVSVERLFKVLRVLQVDLKLTQTAGGSSESGVTEESAAPSLAATSPADNAAASRPAKNASTAAAGDVKRKAPSSHKRGAPSATQARASSPAKQAAKPTPRKARGTTASQAPRAAAKSGSADKKREDW